MEASPFLLQSDNLQNLFDRARGCRRQRLDAAGRVVEAWLADGTRIAVERDPAGMMRTLQSGNSFHLQFEPMGRSRANWRVTAGRRITEIRSSRNGRDLSLESETGRLRIECDGLRRYRRVQVPGSSLALEYEWQGDRRCIVRGEQGEPYLRLHRNSHGLDIDFGFGSRTERSSPMRQSVSISDLQRREVLRFAANLDSQSRPKSRSWSDGWAEEFRRDGTGRLTRWIRRGRLADDIEYAYSQAGLLRERRLTGDRIFDLDEAGRVISLWHPAGEPLSFSYDANGRRVRANSPTGTTRYTFDPLGQLTSIHGPDSSVTESAYDGIGRRVETRWASSSGVTEVRYEHRDADGRLWSVTDEWGRALHTYVWLDGRVLARIDGPVGEPLAETFVSCPNGSLLASIRGVDGELLVERNPGSPFGEAGPATRPTLYGHFGDPRTGLIHFGAREYHPATRSFLTPDPYHGGADDPRRWAGAPQGSLKSETEWSAEGPLPYALCQFDPSGRADTDGHRSVAASVAWGFYNFFMTPTWGWPLTSISLFFFAPLDVYFEFFGRVIQLFRLAADDSDVRRKPGYSTFPWPNHSIFGLRGMFGSARQGHAAFSLNGFLPRVISGGGIGADRAVTIGHVIWIRRHELDVLARPHVIRIWDIDGGAGVTAFNSDPAKQSVLAVVGTSEEGKKWVHVSHWGRGYGNAIGAIGGVDSFVDKPSGGVKPCLVHLAKPLPLDMPFAGESDSKNTTEAREFVHTPGTSKEANAELDTKVAFALRMSEKGDIASGQFLEVSFPDDKDLPFYVLAADAQEDFESKGTRFTVLLYQAFPKRVTDPGAPALEKLTVRRVIADGAATEGWAVAGADTKVIEKTGLAGAAPELAKGDTVFVIAGTAGTPFLALTPTAPPDNHTIGARIKELACGIKLTNALDPGLGADTEVLILHVSGKVFSGKVPDPAKPNEIKFEGAEPDFENGSLIEVTLKDTTIQAKVASYADRVLTITPMGAALAPKKNDIVTVQQLEASSEEQDKAKAASPAGDTPQVAVPRTKPYKAKTALLFRDGAQQQVRIVDGVQSVRVTLPDDVVGTGPFKVRPAKIDDKFSEITGVQRSSLFRFLKRTSGALPSAFQSYPDSVIGIMNRNNAAKVDQYFPALGEFYIRSNDAGMETAFHYRWRPGQFDGTEYFILELDLPLFEEKNDDDVVAAFWYYDRDESTSKFEMITPAPATYEFVVREFDRSAAIRSDGGGQRVLALEGEVIVPEDPPFRFTHRESLIEHELHHAVQNNRFGPFMGAFPLTGLLADVIDFADLAGADTNLNEGVRWLRASFPDEHQSGFSRYQIISVGGLMTVVWKYVILGPFLLGGTIAAEIGNGNDVQQEILKLDFNDLNQVVNPIWGNLIKKYPKINPNDPFTNDPGEVILEWIVRAMDLRSWVPFLGMVPTWLGDSARNFLEQQASRASGDLYSPILSANDRFNHAKRLFPDNFDANFKSPIGQVVRMMVFVGSRSERVLNNTHANCPGSPLTYQHVLFRSDLVTVTCNGSDVLLRDELYELLPGTRAADKLPAVQLEGPDGVVVNFLQVKKGIAFRPALRALVPMPPQVNRAAGFYFAPAIPEKYELTTYADTGDSEAKTHQVTSEFEAGKVTLGGEDVAYVQPPPHGTTPTTKLTRLLTETVELLVADQARELFQVTATGASAGALALTDTEKGWQLEMGKSVSTPGTPEQARVRIYRVIKKNDAADPAKNDPQFNLYYGDGEPSLAGIRTYLDKDVWFLVRDFLVEISEIPNFPTPINKKSDEKHTLNLPLALALPEKLTIAYSAADTPARPLPEGEAIPVPEKKKLEPEDPAAKGEKWEIGPLPELIEDKAVYTVTAEFGKPPRSISKDFKLHIEPALHLTAAGAFEATVGSPLELTVGGAASVDSATADDLPDKVALRIAGNKVTVDLEAGGPAIQPARKIVVQVKSGDKRGRRTVTISREPPPPPPPE